MGVPECFERIELLKFKNRYSDKIQFLEAVVHSYYIKMNDTWLKAEGELM